MIFPNSIGYRFVSEVAWPFKENGRGRGGVGHSEAVDQVPFRGNQRNVTS